MDELSKLSHFVDGVVHPPSTATIGPVMKLTVRITGVDEPTLRHCPPKDWGNVRALGGVMTATFVYQAALFTLTGHQLFAEAGKFQPVILAGGLFLAGFILLIDSYMIMRSGFEHTGIQELKRSGMDISGGRLIRVKANCSLVVRIALAVGLAQLTALFVGLLACGGDVSSRIQDDYLKANASLISHARTLVEARVAPVAEAVTASSTRLTTLSDQISRLRRDIVDPKSGELERAQQEVADLITRKSKAETELQEREANVAAEMGGIKRNGNTSGQAGRGLRYRALQDQVTGTRTYIQQLAVQLDTARARVEIVRTQVAAMKEAEGARGADQLAVYERSFAEETARQAEMKSELERLTSQKEREIRTIVESAPDHVPYAGGLLNRLTVLKRIGDERPWLTPIFLVLDLVAFGFELAAVLCKVTSYVPTVYAKLLAARSYVAGYKMASDLSAVLAGLDGRASPSAPTSPPGKGPSQPDVFAAAPPLAPSQRPGQPPVPVKRPRGRPRIHPLNGSQPPAGKQGQDTEHTDEDKS